MTTRPKIKPAIDVPLIVRLDDTNAPETHSQYTGTEYRYAVTHEGKACFIYLPKTAHEAIQRTRAAAGEELEIVKHARGYSVTLLSDASEQPAHSHVKSTPRDFAETLARESSARRAWAAPKPSNGNGHQPNYENDPHSNGRPLNGHAPQAAAAEDVPGSHLEACLRQAVDAAAAVTEYARKKNFSVTFLGADIRAMANSVMIGDQQRGGRQ